MLTALGLRRLGLASLRSSRRPSATVTVSPVRDRATCCASGSRPAAPRLEQPHRDLRSPPLDRRRAGSRPAAPSTPSSDTGSGAMGETTRAPITTILFTDLVDSTALMQRVGDERAQRLFETHHQLLSDAVSTHGGSELQWLGDGLMVAFASAADAVRCAIAMQQAAAQQPGERLSIRVGLNVGEVLQQKTGSG
ncbi:MAG TPA: hypothetical protein DEP35_17110, partial [Deltaproteobacteria bacterium]|nr:hypothetical protein [Deltaproteobacteria bacterium]